MPSAASRLQFCVSDTSFPVTTRLPYNEPQDGLQETQQDQGDMEARRSPRR